MVHAAARGARRLRRQPDGASERRREVETLQGQRHRRRAHVAEHALPARPGFVHYGRELRSEGRRRLHQHFRIAVEGQGPHSAVSAQEKRASNTRARFASSSTIYRAYIGKGSSMIQFKSFTHSPRPVLFFALLLIATFGSAC